MQSDDVIWYAPIPATPVDRRGGAEEEAHFTCTASAGTSSTGNTAPTRSSAFSLPISAQSEIGSSADAANCETGP